ncbi:MAG: DUF2993 domain-containing protein [Armatimonadetes bacterium]|nr:DUF2993 domain-containing protein [Armatimonadota bacterium]
MTTSRRRSAWFLGLLLLATALIAAGCNTGVAERAAEGKLRRRLPEIIGPAEQYDVDIRASSDLSVMEGRLRTITIEGRQVRVAHTWPVDHILVVLDRVRVNLEKETLQSVGAARFQVTIYPATLVGYLENDEENLRDAQIHLEEGKLTVTGRYLLMGLWTSFRVSGTLELLDHSRIGFRTRGASAAGLPVPARIVRHLEQRLNPVLDVSDTLLPIELTRVEVRPEGVVVSGIPHLDGTSLLGAR